MAKCGAKLQENTLKLAMGTTIGQQQKLTKSHQLLPFIRQFILITGVWQYRYFQNFGEFLQLIEVNSMKFSKKFVQPFFCEKIESPMKFCSAAD